MEPLEEAKLREAGPGEGGPGDVARLVHNHDAEEEHSQNPLPPSGVLPLSTQHRLEDVGATLGTQHEEDHQDGVGHVSLGLGLGSGLGERVTNLVLGLGLHRFGWCNACAQFLGRAESMGQRLQLA